MNFQLAQINVARLIAPLDDPRIKEFVDNLDKINSLAEISSGFVWRLKNESDDGAPICPPSDPLLVVNISVWESVADLKKFTYNSDHIRILRKRLNWFEKPTEAHLALWWIKAGEYPRAEQAMVRLRYLRKHGETATAFSFRKVFEPIAKGQ